MKGLFFFVLIAFSSFSVSAQKSEKINWLTVEEALKLNAEAPRKILIDVYTDWCGYCRIMDSETFNNPIIANYVNKHFYAIKFNAESFEPVNFAGHTFTNQGTPGSRRSTHQFATAMGVNGYPTVVYFTSDLKIIGPIPNREGIPRGFLKPDKMEPILHFVVEEMYTTLSLAQYEKTFVGELKKK